MRSAYVLAPKGTYARVLKKHRALLWDANHGDVEAQEVLLDVLLEHRAEAFPFEGPNDKLEARILFFRALNRDPNVEVYFTGAGRTGRFFRGRILRQHGGSQGATPMAAFRSSGEEPYHDSAGSWHTVDWKAERLRRRTQ